MGRWPVGGGGAAPAPAPNPGRMPGAPERVGCGPRRSPGRIGGRVPGDAADAPPGAGRGRWKIGLPRSGMPPRGAIGAPAGRTGAVYTGRGPLCGTIRRRGGGATPPAGDCPGRGVTPGRSGVAAAFGCTGWAARLAGGNGRITEGATGGCLSTSGVTEISSGRATLASITGTSSSANASVGLAAAGATGVAGGLGGTMTAAGGRGTDCGVMKRGAGFGGSTTGVAEALAAGVVEAVTAGAGLCGTADGGVTV